MPKFTLFSRYESGLQLYLNKTKNSRLNLNLEVIIVNIVENGHTTFVLYADDIPVCRSSYS